MTICQRFRHVALEFPDSIALVSEEEGTKTYQELENYSNQIASIIIKKHIKEESIGVLAHRSFFLVAAMLGIMKAGKAYIPLDPCYPRNHMTRLLNISGASCVLCSPQTASLLGANYEQIIVDSAPAEEFNSIDFSVCSANACILFTSGSTGSPNGVVMTHESILNTVDWAIKFYQLSSQDIDLQVPSCSFTSSVQDIFSTLLSGGTLVIINDRKMLNARYLNMLCHKYKVTHFDMVPSLYSEFLSVAESNNLFSRFVLLAGEPLSKRLVENHFSKLPSVRAVNEYGMAETCSCAFVKELSEADPCVTIGHPITNIDYQILNMDDEGVGELYIAGKGLAKEYINNAPYTKEKFIMREGTRYFKTGDFVKRSACGELQYICRRDNQIKINGKRVSLQDIDMVLGNDTKVIDSVTITLEYKSKPLIASFIKTKHKEPDYFWDMLKSVLPSHSIPHHIELIDDFLYLPNRKKNINAMKEIVREKLEKNESLSPTQYQGILFVLHSISAGRLNHIAVEEDIRAQGLDSIAFIQLLVELERKYGFEFGYNDIEEMGIVSVKSLYEYIEKKLNEETKEHMELS